MTSDPAPGPDSVPPPPQPPYGRPVYGPPSYGQPGYLPPLYGQPGYVQPGYVQPGMLASAADRDRTVDVLKAAFTEGRINKEEFEARTSQVMSARTYADLGAVIADLPSGLGAALVQPYSYHRPPAVAPRTSGLAIGSLICGILWLSVPAVILGHLARGRIKRDGQHGDGLAIAGLVIGYLEISLFLLFLIIGVATAAP